MRFMVGLSDVCCKAVKLGSLELGSLGKARGLCAPHIIIGFRGLSNGSVGHVWMPTESSGRWNIQFPWLHRCN